MSCKCSSAEESTLNGGYERRPDIVLYVNGIAVAVLESTEALFGSRSPDGVRQLITNQEEIFNLPFFAKAELLIAGSDSQGLRYGTVTMREQFFVDWKAPPLPDGGVVPAGAHLDRPLADLCSKARFLDLIRNMVIFDNGVKKVPRHHQFAGDQSRARAHPPARGRRHLAHAGQRQEHLNNAPRSASVGSTVARPVAIA